MTFPPLLAMLTLSDLVLLFPWLFVLMALALAWTWRRSENRKRLLLVTILFAALWITSMPLVSHLALGALEWNYPPAAPPQDVPVIVVLSGGISYGDEVVPQAQLTSDTVERCFAAAELYRANRGSKLLLSGGKVDPSKVGPQLAEAMRDLMLELGVPAEAMWLESTSRSTYENAVESAKLLNEHGIERVVLVTDAAHLPRATRCFLRQGIDVVPWGCRYRARTLRWSPRLFLPDPGAAEGTQAAVHEWVGLVWYRLRGQI